MVDKLKSEKLFAELLQAVKRGDVSSDILNLIRQDVSIGGDVNESIVVSGNNNTVVINKDKPEIDEQALLAESVKEYHQEQISQLAKVSDRPYPGLLPYSLENARQFFGREQAIAELLVKIKTSRVTWLHGRSGTGKSSVIGAGLMPSLLDHGGYPILVRPFGELPTTALKKKLLKGRLLNDSKLEKQSLQQFLTWVCKSLSGQDVYIFFDQFEEFFVKLQDEEKRNAFAQELADCVGDTSLPVHFVFSLLSDGFGETLPLRERLPAGTSSEAFLRPLNRQEAVDVITGPFKQFGISFEDGLVETILQHLLSTEIASPQLQLVCEKLFQSLPEGSRQITLGHYQKLGETKGIIKNYLKQALRDEQVIPADEQKAAIYLLSTLVTPEGGRDAKKLSGWCKDERFRSWALNWHRKKKNLSLADGAPDLQSIRHIAVVNYIRKIEPHVTIKGDDLRQIVQKMEEPILEDYLYQLQKEFVGQVAEALRNARLIHEIHDEDGEQAYELVHDYLVAEVKDWLEADELAARQLRRKLDQKHLDFNQHKLLLEPKELEIITTQLGNPRFALQEADKRLILLSAATHGNGQKWLALCGSKGLDWLREAYQNEQYPEALRQGTVTCLGELDDQPTYNHLLERIRQETETPKQNLWLGLLAHYLNHSQKNSHPPNLIHRKIFLRLASLNFIESDPERMRMSRIAAYLSAMCWVVYYVLNPFEKAGLSIQISTGVVFLLLSMIFSVMFAQTVTALQWIARRWALIWQVLSFSVIGSAIGIFLFLLMAGEWRIGFIGGVISLALMPYEGGRGVRNRLIISLIAVLAFAVTFLILGKDDYVGNLGSALSASVFSGFYLYFSNYAESVRLFK